MSEIKPLYLLAGGNFRNRPQSVVPLLERALKECETQKPLVAYVGTANGDNIVFFEALKSLLRKTGAEVNFVRLAKKRVNLSEAKTALEKADAVFLSGGEVEDGMRWLEHHGLIGFLNELRNRGKLFFGMSAGSIMMGTHWVRWEDENDDATASLFECLGFASTIFDTHAEEEDWKELKAALKLRGPGAQGYGISAGGLVRVDSQGQMTVLEKTLIPYENVGGRVRKV